MELRLCIPLEKLPEEGPLHFTGELDPVLFDLHPDDAVPVGPLSYDLMIERMGTELFIQGKISAPFEFTCVRNLEPFKKTVCVDKYSASFDIDDQEIMDISDELREEILLSFPPYPRCDLADTPHTCELNSSYLDVDKHPSERVNTSRTDGNKGVWDALDSLQQKTEESL